MNGLHSSPTPLDKLRTSRNDRSPHPKEMVRKSITADQLLETLPVRFKKPVRQLIEEYQSERVELLKLLKQTPTSDLEIYSYKKKLEQLVQENIWLAKEVVGWQDKSRILQFQLEELHRRLQEKQKEVEALIVDVSVLNSTLELSREQQEHHDAMFKHRISRLERQLETSQLNLATKDKQVKEKQQQLAHHTSEMKQLQSRLGEMEKQRTAANSRAEGIEKQLRKKKIVEIRETLSKSREKDQQTKLNTPTTPEFQELMKSSCFRKLSQAFSPKIISTSTLRVPISDSIKRAKQMLTNKFDKKQDNSEHDSLQFGKQKVIEKKKIRKMLTDLLSAAPSERKLVLERLSLEIGLKQADVERFLELF